MMDTLQSKLTDILPPDAVYDAARWASVHTRFLNDAKALTDGDVALLALVDPRLGERARAKRAGFVEADDPEMQQFDKHPISGKQFWEWHRDVLTPLLLTYRFKSREAHVRLEALERRVQELEAKPHVKFCGVWKTGRTYVPGDAATHHGGLWICKAETLGEPSKDFAGWTLAVKKGAA